MKKIIFMFLLSLALFSFGYSQEQKRNQIGLSAESRFILFASGITLNFTPAIGEKVAIDVVFAYYTSFTFKEYSPLYISLSAAPMFKVYSKKKLTFLAGAGAKIFLASGGYLEGTELTPIAFLKGLMEYDLNGSLGVRAGISQNMVIYSAWRADESILIGDTTFDFGVYLRF
jgi:hypothetical protein